MLVAFTVTTLYVPISKISIDSLVWSSDFWAVPVNPYLNGVDFPVANVTQIGMRDPLDFCWVTSMDDRAFNMAFFILPMSILSIFALTIWFPIRLWRVVNASVPTIDPYTELGERRREVDAEYARLIDRDQHSFSFLYSFYRRRWAGYKSI